MLEMNECLEVTKQNAKKLDEVIKLYECRESEYNLKDRTITSQLKTIRIQSIIFGVCFVLFLAYNLIINLKGG